jgi:hypothetical protein
MTQPSTVKPATAKLIFGVGVLPVLLAVLFAGVITGYVAGRSADLPTNPISWVVLDDTDKLIAMVRSKVEVGDSQDKPGILKVSDVEVARLTNPELYEGVENDDRVMIFEKKAVIYRPSTGKIVKVVGLT